MSARISAAVIGACLVVGSAVAAFAPRCALAQQQQSRALNEKVGTPLQAATTAARNKQFDVALAKAKEAEGQAKTPYEQFKVNETFAFIYGSQRRYAELAGAYEKMLATPQFVDQSKINTKAVAQTYSAAKQHAKAVEYAKRWLQDRPNDAETMHLLGQSYYLMGDQRSCKDTMAGAIAAVEKSGSRPDKNWLDLVRSCADAQGDTATATQSLEKLVRYYPSPQVWHPYISNASRNSSDLAEFHWMRLRSEVGALREADDCSLYAQEAMITYGSPGESARVVEECFKNGILGTEDRSKARHDNLRARAKEAAAADKARIAALAAEAEKDPTGEKSIALGLAHFGAENYDQAITHLEQGIKKGGAKDLAHAKLTLGVAQLRKGQRDSARATFRSLGNDDSIGKIASAWMLRSYN
jgi:tetratricopeptide (TPR) repeat protein